MGAINPCQFASGLTCCMWRPFPCSTIFCSLIKTRLKQPTTGSGAAWIVKKEWPPCATTCRVEQRGANCSSATLGCTNCMWPPGRSFAQARLFATCFHRGTIISSATVQDGWAHNMVYYWESRLTHLARSLGAVHGHHNCPKVGRSIFYGALFLQPIQVAWPILECRPSHYQSRILDSSADSTGPLLMGACHMPLAHQWRAHLTALPTITMWPHHSKPLIFPYFFSSLFFLI